MTPTFMSSICMRSRPGESDFAVGWTRGAAERRLATVEPLKPGSPSLGDHTQMALAARFHQFVLCGCHLSVIP